MEVVDSILHSQEGCILGVLLGSFAVVRLLRLSSSVSLLATGTPFALSLLDTQLVAYLRAEFPVAMLCCAWFSTAAVGGLAKGVSPAWHGLVGPIGIFRLGHIIAMMAALLVVTALFVAPDMLAAFAPEWRSTFGGLLLAVSVLSMSRAIARLLKAGVVLAVWSGVAVVLASQVFLQKMPQAIERQDLAGLHALVGSETAGRILTSVFDTLSRARDFSALLDRVEPVSSDARNLAPGLFEGTWVRNTGLAIGRNGPQSSEPAA